MDSFVPVLVDTLIIARNDKRLNFFAVPFRGRLGLSPADNSIISQYRKIWIFRCIGVEKTIGKAR